MSTTQHPRILILGAGFAGAAVAQELARLLPAEEVCDITVVDQNNFSLFTPMLTEVAGGEVDPSSIVAAVRSLSPRVTFRQGRVEMIDAANRSVTLRIGDEASGIPVVERTLDADHLVIALGSITNFHHIDGLEEHSLTIKTVEEAEAIRNRAIALLERADEEPDRATRNRHGDNLLRFSMSSFYRLGDYLLALEGLAILRQWGTDAEGVRARAEEIAAITAGLKDGPYGDVVAIPEYDVAAGYGAWAAMYDSMTNFLIEVEERAVHPLLDARPAGRALDAACGTGRHARWLAERGHEVVGIDATEEMLRVARAKVTQRVPAARFHVGRLEALSLPSESVDLAVCALALTHLPALDRAIAELARVLAPGGHLVLSDVHPMCAALGLHAFFRTVAGGRGCIQNRYHPMSSYLGAFRDAHLEVVRCIEVPWDEHSVAAQPTFPLIPQAIQTALRGLPLLLVWELSVPSDRPT